jgi:cobalt-zinc-cadmium efflux system outer membrane protein
VARPSRNWPPCVRSSREHGYRSAAKWNRSLPGWRFEAGEDTKLDNNLAGVELGRSRNQLESVRESLIQARAELAATVQLPPEQFPAAKGTLVVKPELPYTLEQLAAAAASRPQLRALEHREQAARSRLGLERAAVYPDVTVGLGAGREGPGAARENLFGVSVSVPLPLFRRNAAGIGKASTELTQLEIERRAAMRDTRARVFALWQKLESLRQRVHRLENRSCSSSKKTSAYPRPPIAPARSA